MAWCEVSRSEQELYSTLGQSLREREAVECVESEPGWVRRAFLHRMAEVDKGEEGDPAKQPHQGTRVCAVKRAV